MAKYRGFIDEDGNERDYGSNIGDNGGDGDHGEHRGREDGNDDHFVHRFGTVDANAIDPTNPGQMYLETEISRPATTSRTMRRSMSKSA